MLSYLLGYNLNRVSLRTLFLIALTAGVSMAWWRITSIEVNAGEIDWMPVFLLIAAGASCTVTGYSFGSDNNRAFGGAAMGLCTFLIVVAIFLLMPATH